ncbi:hypothetical protein ACQ86N_00350 [Puia sp. P3]|uniref:hypothetical protein n=1 Tax=Puia sp. P3 TaxID=3423952 RepID=UPI003D66A86B
MSAADKKKIDHLLATMTVEEKAAQLASFYPNGNTRLNIPHMQAGECLHGVVADGATSFPSAIALGSTGTPNWPNGKPPSSQKKPGRWVSSTVIPHAGRSTRRALGKI